MDIRALPYILLLGVIFGSNVVLARFSTGQFAPTTYSGLCLLIASLAYGLVYLFRVGGRKWPRDRALWRHAAISGTLDIAIPMILMVTALQYLSSGVVSTLATINPVVIVLLAHYFLPDEPLTVHKILGVVLALCGAVLLTIFGGSGLSDIGQANLLGYILVVVSMLTAGGAAVYIRRYMREINPFDAASARTMVATLVVVPISLLIAGFDLSAVDQSGYIVLGIVGTIGTFFAFLLGFYNVQRFGAGPASVAAYVVPVVATLGGVLFLGEQVTPGMLASMALIIIGIAVLNQRARPTRTPSPPMP
jgi:drug/metabolite transporter (DMT)-like permease